MRIFSSIALAATLAASSARADDAPAPRPPVFAPGEQTVLHVDYSGIRAGTATITVGNPILQGTTQVWPIVTLADTESLFAIFPLHDKFITWWDFTRNHSIGWEFYANENHHARRERVKLNVPATGKAQIQRTGEDQPAQTLDAEIDPTAQDIAAAFFALRELKLEPGTEARIPVFTGRHSWDLFAHVNGVEPIEVGAGKFEAIALDVQVHFEGKLASKRDLKIWLSNDAHHALLKVEAELALGSLNAEAAEYHPGAP